MKYTELYIQFLENLVETKSCELQDIQSKLDDASMSVNRLFDAVDEKNSEIARLNDEFNALAKEKRPQHTQHTQHTQNEGNTKVLEVQQQEMQQVELERQRLANECYQLKVANGNFLKVIETQDKNRIALKERIKDLESIVANKDAAIEDSINKRLKVIIQLDKAEDTLKALGVKIHRDPEGIKPTTYTYTRLTFLTNAGNELE
jgi:chromosome segregation ATPase